MKPTLIIPGLVILAASASLTSLFVWAVQHYGWVMLPLLLAVIASSSFLLAAFLSFCIKEP